MIIVPNLSYEQYEDIADAIYSTIPFSLISCQYRKRLKKGFFYFWDLEYVPESLLKFKIAPPKNHEDIDNLKRAIETALKG